MPLPKETHTCNNNCDSACKTKSIYSVSQRQFSTTLLNDVITHFYNRGRLSRLTHIMIINNDSNNNLYSKRVTQSNGKDLP